MTRSITKPEYDRFVAEVERQLNVTVVNKDNLESDAVAIVLHLLKIQDKNEFLASTATTFGTVIYIPDEFSLDKRVDVIAHECEHAGPQYQGLKDVAYGKWLDVAQRAALEAGHLTPFIADILERLRIDESRIRPKGFGFMWLYLTQREERAVFEAHAYCTAMEFQAFRWGGPIQSLESMVERLRHGYDLDVESVVMAGTIIEIRRTELALNGPGRSSVAKRLHRILYDISPELVAVAPT